MKEDLLLPTQQTCKSGEVMEYMQIGTCSDRWLEGSCNRWPTCLSHQQVTHVSLSPTGDPRVSLTNRWPTCLSHQQATHLSLSPTGDPRVSLTNRRPTCLSHQQVTHLSLSPTGDPRVSLTNRWPTCLSHQQVTHVSLSPTGDPLVSLTNRWPTRLSHQCLWLAARLQSHCSLSLLKPMRLLDEWPLPDPYRGEISVKKRREH